MRLVLAGANGYIGQKTVSFFNGAVPLSRSEGFDLNNISKFDYSQIQNGDLVLMLAAQSSPDQCANNYESAYNINVKGTAEFLDKCLERGARIIFASSDTVYGEDSVIFDESSVCAPFGEYAEMKYIIEKRYVNNDNVKIFRLSYIFSFEDKFTKYLLTCLDNNDIAEVYTGFYRNCAYIVDLMQAIDYYMNNWNISPKILNICGNELLSRDEMADIFKAVARSSLQIKKITPPEGFFEKRPKIINVHSLYFHKLLNREQHTYKNGLIKELENKHG